MEKAHLQLSKVCLKGASVTAVESLKRSLSCENLLSMSGLAGKSPEHAQFCPAVLAEQMYACALMELCSLLLHVSFLDAAMKDQEWTVTAIAANCVKQKLKSPVAKQIWRTLPDSLLAVLATVESAKKQETAKQESFPNQLADVIRTMLGGQVVEKFVTAVIGELDMDPPEYFHEDKEHKIEVGEIGETFSFHPEKFMRSRTAREKEVSIVPTGVVRLHAFRDEWPFSWEDLCKRPIREITDKLPLLQLCRLRTCPGDCGHYHLSVEEDGAESVLLDFWSWRWSALDGSKKPPKDAQVFQLYIRCPEGAVDALQSSSGKNGLYFEPRQDGAPGSDTRFSVIWIQGSDLQQVLHLHRTDDLVHGVARIGSRYGVKVRDVDFESMHKKLCPNKPFLRGPIPKYGGWSLCPLELIDKVWQKHCLNGVGQRSPCSRHVMLVVVLGKWGPMTRHQTISCRQKMVWSQ